MRLKFKRNLTFILLLSGLFCNESAWSKELFPFTGKIKLEDGDWKDVGANFHSLQEYLNALADVGFRIVSFNEPAVSEELVKKYPDLKSDSLYPAVMVIDAVKD